MKPHIVLLHGWGSNPNRWKVVRESLEKNGFTVHVPYLPGFDINNPIKKPFTIDDYSLWLKDYIKKIDSPHVFLIGHSHGGRIIARYMFKYGQKISKIVLIGAAGLPQELSLHKKLIKKMVDKYRKNVYKILPKIMYNILQHFIYKILGESDYITLNKIMKITMNNMLHHDSTNDYASIKIPTLLLWGDQDSYTPLSMGKKLSHIIDNSTLITIKGGAHGLHLTHPTLVAKYILKHLINIEA